MHRSKAVLRPATLTKLRYVVDLHGGYNISELQSAFPSGVSVTFVGPAGGVVPPLFGGDVPPLFGGVFVGAGPLLNSRRERLVALSAINQLPASFGSREAVVAGGLMSYAASQS